MPASLRLDNNNWTIDIEKRYQAQGEEALGYQWILAHWVRYLWFGNQIWFWISIVFQTIVTILAGIHAIIADNNDHLKALSVIVAILSAVSESMSIAGRFYNFDDLINMAENSQMDFSKHASRITTTLACTRDRRKDAIYQAEQWDSAWESLLDGTKQLKVPQYIINKYRKKFEKSPIKRPNIAGDIEKIDIVVDSGLATSIDKSVDLEAGKNTNDEDDSTPELQRELEAAMSVRKKQSIDNKMADELRRLWSDDNKRRKSF